MGVKRLFKVGVIAVFGLACTAILLCNLSALGFRSLGVPTGSMRPTIPPGSLVLVHRVPASSLKVGDVITYINPLKHQQSITHRIVKTYKISGRVPGFVTKGDANKYPDRSIAGGSVVGKVVWHVPYIGFLMQKSKTWVGIAMLVYLPALLVMIEEVRRLSEYFRTGLPYKLYGFRREVLEVVERRHRHPLALSSGVAAVLTLLIGAVFWEPAFALLHTNTVALTSNKISVANSNPKGGGACSNNTNINVNNSSSQTAQTGSATGGSATSGNASNSNNTNININIKNGC